MAKNYDFVSSDGKTLIHTQAWLPKGEKLAVVQLTHGMVEYIARYDEFARYLTEHGYVVVGHDHLGHGETARTPEDFGYFGDGRSDTLVKDMHTLRQRVQRDYPELPYFMLGHSMGSYMLRKYLSLHAHGLSGAIVMGTGYVSNATTRMGLVLNKVITLFKGEHYRSAFMANMATGNGPYKQFCLDGSDPTRSWLTKDVEIVKKYYQDKYCTFVFTLNGYRGLLESVLFDNTPENVRKIDPSVPIYLVSGTEDPVGDMSKGVQTVEKMFKEAGIRDVEMRLFEGDRHEILNETDRREVVYPTLLDWLERHRK